MDEAHKTLWDWYGTIETVTPAPEVPVEVLNALSDDLNTPEMIAEFHKLFREKRFADLRSSLHLLGFSGSREKLVRVSAGSGSASGAASGTAVGSSAEIEGLIASRLAARKARNWAEADRIRDELSAMGIVLMDAKNPVTGEIETTWKIAR